MNSSPARCFRTDRLAEGLYRMLRRYSRSQREKPEMEGVFAEGDNGVSGCELKVCQQQSSC